MAEQEHLSLTSSLTKMISTPGLRVLFKPSNYNKDVLCGTNRYSIKIATHRFMQGDVFGGMQALGAAFPNIFEFWIIEEGESREHGRLKNRRFDPLKFYRDKERPGILTIWDCFRRETLRKIDCRTSTGRRKLIQFIHDWAKDFKDGKKYWADMARHRRDIAEARLLGKAYTSAIRDEALIKRGLAGREIVQKVGGLGLADSTNEVVDVSMTSETSKHHSHLRSEDMQQNRGSEFPVIDSQSSMFNDGSARPFYFYVPSSPLHESDTDE